MLLPLQNIYAQGYQPFRLHHNSNIGILQQSMKKMDEQHKRSVESIPTKLKEAKLLIDNQNYQEAYDLLNNIINDKNIIYDSNLSEEIEKIGKLRDYCKKQAKEKKDLETIQSSIESALEYMDMDYYKEAHVLFNKSLDLIAQGDYTELFGESIIKIKEMRDFCKEQVKAQERKDLEAIQDGIEAAKEYMNNKNYNDAYTLFEKSIYLIIQGNYNEHFKESIKEINQMRDFCKDKIESELKR